MFTKNDDSHYNNSLNMRLVIFAIVAFSLLTFVVKSEGNSQITQEELRMLQKQKTLSKGFLSSFFGSNSQGTKTDNNEDNTQQQDLENNLDQLAKALPYQMLLPRRKNSFSSPLGLLGNLIKAKNQQQSILDKQDNPLEELNQLLASRKKKSEKKAFHWQNPDFKEGKNDIPIYKIFGSKSKRNHRLQISEEQVQNILEKQIPAFRGGRLLKLLETSYSKGFFLKVEFLTTKSQVYKVKAKYDQQDNQLQLISMSQLINFQQPEDQQQIIGEEEEQDKFIIEEILSEQEDEDNYKVKQQQPSSIKQQPAIQKPVQKAVQIKKQEGKPEQKKKQQKIVQKPVQIQKQETKPDQKKEKQRIVQKPVQKKEQEAKPEQKIVQKSVQKPVQIKQQKSKPNQKKEQPKIAQKQKIEEKIPEPKIQKIKKDDVKESIKPQPVKLQKNIVAQPKKIEKILQEPKVQTKLPTPLKAETKKDVIKEQKKQKQPVKQQRKDQKPLKEAEKIPTNLSKEQQKVDKPTLKSPQKQEKNPSKSQPKPSDKPTSDKISNSIIVQN